MFGRFHTPLSVLLIVGIAGNAHAQMSSTKSGTILRLHTAPSTTNPTPHGDVSTFSPGAFTLTGVKLTAFASWPYIVAQTGTADQYSGFVVYDSNVNDLFRVRADGKVGIGTSTPTEALDVHGNINVTGNINAKYQDVAEWVASGKPLAPGTVVVLDRQHSDRVRPSSVAYDTTVAGVVSAEPGIILGEAGPSKSKIATTGRVRVKVDATASPIAVGDLLVTSNRAGLAMKSEPMDFNGRKFHQPGTIIGKALEPLLTGQGDIPVLLSLQ